MAWQYNPTIWFVIGIITVCSGMAIYAWPRRHLASRRVGFVASLVTVLWAGCYAMQLSTSNVDQAYLWMSLATIVPAMLPLFWFVVAYQLAFGHPANLTGTALLLAVVPAVSIWLLFFPGVGGPMSASAQMLDVEGIKVLKVIGGPWFRVYLAYTLSLMVLTVAMLATQARHLAPGPRRRAYTMLAAVALLMFVNGLYLVGWITWQRFHPSSLTSLVTQVVFLIGLVSTPIVDIRPIAREHVIESMRDGLMVFDLDGRIVDVSPAAVAMLGLNPHSVLGEKADTVLAPWPALADLCQVPGATTVEIEMFPDTPVDPYRWVEARMQPLIERGRHRMGCVVMLRDITARKQAEIERERLVQELRDALAEVKTLQGLLPVCAWCGKIRDDEGNWSSLTSYVETHYDASVTHGMCPECAAKFAAGGDALIEQSTRL